MYQNGGGQEEDGRGEPTPSDSVVASDAAIPGIDSSVLELDRAFSVLSHPRRRYLMYALAENPEWTLRELATKLAAWETDVDERDVDAQTRDRFYTSLYHTHVPKLVAQGVAEYDAETGTIARTNHAKQVFAVLAGAGGCLDSAQEQHAEQAYDDESEPNSAGE